MSLSLDAHTTALILIDLQEGILSMPLANVTCQNRRLLTQPQRRLERARNKY